MLWLSVSNLLWGMVGNTRGGSIAKEGKALYFIHKSTITKVSALRRQNNSVES